MNYIVEERQVQLLKFKAFTSKACLYGLIFKKKPWMSTWDALNFRPNIPAIFFIRYQSTTGNRIWRALLSSWIS
jgi:hypothetical protein